MDKLRSMFWSSPVLLVLICAIVVAIAFILIFLIVYMVNANKDAKYEEMVDFVQTRSVRYAKLVLASGKEEFRVISPVVRTVDVHCKDTASYEMFAPKRWLKAYAKRHRADMRSAVDTATENVYRLDARSAEYARILEENRSLSERAVGKKYPIDKVVEVEDKLCREFDRGPSEKVIFDKKVLIARVMCPDKSSMTGSVRVKKYSFSVRDIEEVLFETKEARREVGAV